MKTYLLRLFAFVLIGLASPSLWAQVTTSAVSGTITDQSSKESLIGATVLAKHLPSGTTYGAVTNAKGNFSITGMRPGGPYTLTISYVGYESLTLSNINLSLGETETFKITLKDGATQIKDVVITGQKGSNFNLQKTGAGSSVCLPCLVVSMTSPSSLPSPMVAVLSQEPTAVSIASRLMEQ